MTADRFETSELVLALTAREFCWLKQEVDREIKTLEHLLGGLSIEERKQAAQSIIKRCMTTLRKGGESC